MLINAGNESKTANDAILKVLRENEIKHLDIIAASHLHEDHMLLSATHTEEGEEKLHLIMVDNHIPAGAKLY